MGDRWRVDDGIVVRTAVLPLGTLIAWAAEDPRAYLSALLDRPEIDEAIFVATPSLHAAIASWRADPASAANRRVELALAKYVTRMAARATPFGLFSSVSTGAIGRETRIELGAREAYRRRTRLDIDYLAVLAAELAGAHRDQLAFRPNDSLVRVAGKLRCAVGRVEQGVRRYDLISIEPTPYLEATLSRAAGGATIQVLAASLVDDEITRDEADAYIRSLIESEVLVPELGVHVTGPEPIDGLITQLRATHLAQPAAVLATARDALAALDAREPTPAPVAADYVAIAQGLRELPAKVELARLFQVDLWRPAQITVDRRIAADLLEVVGQLARIARAEHASLAEFRRAFLARWDGREVPLAVALDEEAGIGFEVARVPGSEGSPLLAGIPFPAPPRAAPPWRHAHLLRRLAQTAAGDELVLTAADFEAMALPVPARVPDAFSAIVRLGTDDVFLAHTSGPSGARLLARFCHLSPEITAIVRAHHAREEALVPDAVVAEIVHLDEGKIGNVLCRPVLRAHELVYLGTSGAPRDQQLTLDDLLVSVRGERIILRSRRLGREVIPRLTTTHDFQQRGLGAYRFLCRLALQGVTEVGWSWGPLASAPHLPRVRSGRVVLARATWNLDPGELAAIKRDGAAGVTTLRQVRRLPRFVVLVDGDHELVIDLDNPLLVDVLVRELAGRDAAQLVELYPDPEAAVAHGPEGSFVHEAILTFTRDGEPARAAPLRRPPSIQRAFLPGSEWLYAKIYCGESTADVVLRDVIAPIVRAHGGPWFFLRYHDPEPHLRVRLRGAPAALWGDVVPALQRELAPLVEAGIVRKLVFDTYDRELERYGGDAAIELVEQMFWRDSEAVLGIVELLEGDAGADARWRLAVRGIESMLEAIGLAPADRERVVTSSREMLGREMHAETPLWSRIGDRFAAERASLDQLFTRDPARDAEDELAPGFALLADRDAHLAPLARQLRDRDVAVDALAPSLVHMHANRMLHASQRAQELVLYDFLRRLHASSRARRG